MSEITEAGRVYLPLEEIHAEELKMLLAFDAFCSRHGLRNSLAGGTLLGAVRHKGFIPWDDDVDLCMARPDWDRLVSLGRELEGETGLVLAPYTMTDMGATPFVKVVNPGIAVQAKAEQSGSFLWLDVFPVDGLPSTESEVDDVYRRAKRIRSALFLATSTAASGHSVPRRMVKAVAGPVLRAAHAERGLGARLDRFARRIPYGSTAYVGAITWGMYGPGERMALDGFEERADVEFEGHVLPCMSCWHEYLTGIYGDYMQLPPEHKRVTHGMKAWRVEGAKR